MSRLKSMNSEMEMTQIFYTNIPYLSLEFVWKCCKAVSSKKNCHHLHEASWVSFWKSMEMGAVGCGHSILEGGKRREKVIGLSSESLATSLDICIQLCSNYTSCWGLREKLVYIVWEMLGEVMSTYISMGEIFSICLL